MKPRKHLLYNKLYQKCKKCQLCLNMYFDTKTNFIKIGLAMSDHQFEFESGRLSNRTEYKIIEKK